MQNFINAPHRGDTPGVPTGSPNAALLIDFDNVTMGIRSDLTRQLKELLNSDIIRGKVAVQRAYADWRRYAQYIVPLSEASVDLIFAPAYGSSKKNATDIRLAIDALELVFTRPEIGVYILLSGDSDFSSLVLKLKEYGKYVIGVGLRESASDLLVQNCDEYFSYSSLTGLTKAGEEDVVSKTDPWDLAERAVQRMADENDVMRSDRLKQVMLGLDPGFDEGEIGYSKFNKFLTEAASRNKLALKKLDNGQYEVQPIEEGGREREERGRSRRRPESRSESRPEPRSREKRPQAEPPREVTPAPKSRSERSARKPSPKPATRERKEEDLKRGYDLLQRAVQDLIDGPGAAARDSDIKRQILEIESGWDESELGFTKFSRFLRQAHDAEIIDLQRTSEGYYEARLPKGVGGTPGRKHERGPAAEQEEAGRAESGRSERGRGDSRRRDRGERGDRANGGRQEEKPATQATAPAPESKSEETPAERADERSEEKTTQATRPAPESTTEEAEAASSGRDRSRARDAGRDADEPEAKAEPAAEKAEGPARGAAAGKPSSGRYGRRGRRGAADGPPPLLPGQVVGKSAAGSGPASEAAEAPAPDETSGSAPADEPEPAGAAEDTASDRPAGAVEAERAEPAPEPRAEPRTERAEPEAAEEPAMEVEEPAEGVAEPAVSATPSAPPAFDTEELGLPTENGAVIRYLSNSYQGVGQKTAEALIDQFGAEGVFVGLHTQPDRVREVLGSGRRTEVLLEAWQRDYRRRTAAETGDSAES